MEKVLFICTGNICRSPIGEGILKHKILQYNLPLIVDSAGTHSYHEGESYDKRSLQELKKNDIDLSLCRSRPVVTDDLEKFDWLFIADHKNLRDLRIKFGDDVEDKVTLMTEFSSQYHGQDVPDPYYGHDKGFETVYSMLDESITMWLRHQALI